MTVELTEADRGLIIARDNFEVFSANFLKVKAKSGKIVPFVWNRAQQYLHARIEKQRQGIGYVRALVLKGRQQGACLAPHHRVLLEDLTWKRIGDMLPGDRVVAVDESIGDSGVTASGRQTCRRFKTATVEAVAWHRKPTLEVTLESGRRLTVTADHRMLFLQRGGTYTLWREMGQAKVGDCIRSAFRAPPNGELTYEDGWFAGIIDGEGNRSSFQKESPSVAVHQVAGYVLDRIKAYLEGLGIRYYETIDIRRPGNDSKLGNKDCHRLEVGRSADLVYLMNRCLTSRIKFSSADFDGRKIGGNRSAEGEGKQESWDRIVSIEPGETIEVVDLQTSAKTYIVDGLVSHNSTYIGARFYHRTSMNFGQSAFIMAHEDKATSNLFDMVKRYHDHNDLAPSTKASNAQELVFGVLDGGYKLATAGSKDVGRSNTVRLLHGSEVGFWANAEGHMAGIGNTVPSGAEAEGTEIILESTANGIGGSFHKMWQAAESGVDEDGNPSEYIAIFIPWFWQDEYRTPVRDGFVLSAEAQKVMDAYGLDMEQMQWRADKIASYGKGMGWLFKQEYPCTAAEAFQTSTLNPLISPEDVSLAVNNKGWSEMQGPFIIGCDPAEEGFDRTAIVFRTGRTVWRCEYHEKKRTMQVAGILADMWIKGVEFRGQRVFPDAIFIDRIGIGAGIVDRLHELNIPVIGVHSGERANESDIYENKRAEMWWNMKEWTEDHPNRLPNDAALISDLIAPQPAVTSKSKRLLESKKDMKKRGIRSPDGGDALALTFAEPVLPRVHTQYEGQGGYRAPTKAGY